MNLSELAHFVGALGAAVAAILGGVAAVISARNARKIAAVHEEVRTTNGTTIGQTVERIEKNGTPEKPWDGSERRKGE